MTIANVDMAKAWDGEEGDHWTDQADRYEKVGKMQNRLLIETAEVEPEARVLDLGCGTGWSSIAAAQAASHGSVLGVDLSARMLERARHRAKEQGVDNVEFLQADAQVHPFETGAFDLAVSSFGVMFFADPAAAFSNISSALRPGGRLVAMVWQPLEKNEWLMAMREALAVGRSLPAPPSGAPGPFGLDDPERVRTLLGDAGFADLALAPVDGPMYFGSDADDAWSFVRTMGIVKGLTESLDEASRATALTQLRQLLADRTSTDGVTLPSSSWLITAVRP
jgi:SAM-dependent methyltransferase